MIFKNGESYPLPSKGQPFKPFLIYYGIVNSPLPLSKNDPFLKLINNFEDVKKILSIKDIQITKFLFFSKNIIHKILFDADEIIEFEYRKDFKNLFFNFYLCSLIEGVFEFYNPNDAIMHYKYDLRNIKEINEKQTYNNIKLKNTFWAKILIILSNEYKSNEDISGETEGLNDIIKKNSEIIDKSIKGDILAKINISSEKFNKKKIDDIYFQILKYLLEKEELAKKETYDILEEMDLENIYLGQKNYEELIKIFKTKADFIEKFLIKSKEDLFKPEKINFNYIILKYIFKKSYDIYQLKIFADSKKVIMKLIRAKEPIMDKSRDKDKIEYILTFFTGSKSFKKIKKHAQPFVNNILSYLIKEDFTQINCLKYLSETIENKKYIDKFIEYHNRFMYFDMGSFCKELNVKEEDKSKFTDIIYKLHDILSDENIKYDFKDLLKKYFFFTKSIIQFNPLEKELPKKTDKMLIEYFRNWLNDEKNG